MTPLTLATLAAATVLCYTGHLTGEAWAQLAAWALGIHAGVQ